MRILILEQDPAASTWLASQTEAVDEGDEPAVELLFADSDAQAWPLLLDRRPDAFVLDAASVARSGTALWRHLMSRGHGDRKVPVLVYASSRRWDGYALRLASLADGLLRRPFRLDTLLHVLRPLAARWEQDYANADDLGPVRAPQTVTEGQAPNR